MEQTDSQSSYTCMHNRMMKARWGRNLGQRRKEGNICNALNNKDKQEIGGIFPVSVCR